MAFLRFLKALRPVFAKEAKGYTKLAALRFGELPNRQTPLRMLMGFDPGFLPESHSIESSRLKRSKHGRIGSSPCFLIITSTRQVLPHALTSR